MAATETDAAPVKEVESVPTPNEKHPEKLSKVEKPDEEKYKKDLAEADKQLSSINEKLTAVRAKIDGSTGKGPNSTKISELRVQLDQIKEKQASLKSGKAGIQTQIDSLKAKIEREQNDLKAKRGKINYRSTDEIDREIINLEKEVETGTLRLVDEKNNLKRVQTLKAVKRQFAEFNKIEESIKADIAKRKKLQDELNSSTSTPEAKALSEEFNRTRDEIAKLRSANDDAYAKRGELLTQREELQKQRDKAYEHKKNVQNEYYKQRDAYRAWNEQNRKLQSEKYWSTREVEERARIAHNASVKLEAASQDAFANEIWKCENLLRYFGGAEGLTPTTPNKSPVGVPTAPTARAVEASGLTKLASKKNRDADDFILGMKKPQQQKPKPATPKAATKPKRFVLTPDVMSDLGQLGVALPTSDEEVKATTEALKEKLTYYKENQARVTQENIAKATKENEDTERKQLAAFFDKKEADLSGRKNASNQRAKKSPSSDRKERQPKEKKVNGNHSTEAPGTPEETASTDEVEPAKENGVSTREETPEVAAGDDE